MTLLRMGFLDRQQTVADPGYNRWLFPPAALAVHLSIGQVSAFSVFKLPLTVGNLDNSPEIAGAFQVEGLRPREQSNFDRLPSASSVQRLLPP